MYRNLIGQSPGRRKFVHIHFENLFNFNLNTLYKLQIRKLAILRPKVQPRRFKQTILQIKVTVSPNSDF